MLLVFVKYGRPIERDTQVLVENHLRAAQQQRDAEAADPFVNFQRRQRVYRELANREIEHIMRAMFSYS